MESFKQHIKSIHQSDWDYYYDISGQKLNHPFNSRHSHKKFIKSYFYRAGKEKIFKFINFIPNKELNNNRLKHTSSIFFLGVLLKTKTSFRWKIFTEANSPGYSEFPFIWFLSCLFHDFAITIEEDPKTIKNVQSFKSLLDRFRIENNLLSTNKDAYEIFTPNLIENYFKYRISQGKIDHGILGGLYLFDRLLKIRLEKFDNRNSPLYWGEDLIDQYAKACYAILCHNIWTPQSDKQAEVYKENGLSNLVDNFEPISLSRFPLLYILGIVDTIDPIKTYKDTNFSPNVILQNVLFEFSPNNITISMRKNSPLDFNKLKCQTNYLKGWLDVNIVFSNRDITITFNE